MKHIYDDSKFINSENILLFCNTNEEFLELPVKGIIVELPGLGGSSCLGGWIERVSYDSKWAIDFGRNGIILAYMFPGPWSWGNKGAIRYTDAVVRAIAQKYDLKENFPLAVCGGSMGGAGAFLYAADSTLPVCGCAVGCPVIDVPGRILEDPNTPRTIISAASVYDLPLEEALKQFSPIHRVGDMPPINYFISSDGDDLVYPEMQCEDFIEKLKNRGADVIYRPQPGLPHGGFLPEVRQELHDFLKKQILG